MTTALWRRVRRWGQPAAEAARREGSTPSLRQLPDPGIDAVVDANVDWLRWAQERSTSNDGGVAAHYDIVASRWSTSYPETTGYVVPTLLDYARRRGDADAQRRARRMLDWLASMQFADGGFPGGYVDHVPQVPVVFNTGQILLGLAAGEREFGGYRQPLRRAADWLAAAQDADGCWRRHPSPFVAPGEKTYDVHAAWGLLEADRADPGRGYADAALRNIRWALTRQRGDGFIDQCCLEHPERPLTHTLGYSLRGIIEGYRAEGGDDILTAARLTADGLLRCLNADGFLPGRIEPGWRPAVRWACLTGTAQVAACWLMLHQITGQRRYLAAGRSANTFVRRPVRLAGPPGLRGGVTGAWPIDGGYQPNRCLNWAAKFCIDSNLLESEVRSHPRQAERNVRQR